jgi:hypothetical protein
MMFAQIIQRYQAWDAQTMATLSALSEGKSVPDSSAFLARSLSKLSRIEVLQLYHFCQKWRGPLLWKRLVQMSLLFVLLGVGLYMYKQKAACWGRWQLVSCSAGQSRLRLSVSGLITGNWLPVH